MRKFLLFALCELLLPVGPLLAQRLPNNVVPESYDLRFEPDLTKADFEGEETIHVQLLSSTNVVVLNEAEIQFKDATVVARGLSQTASVEADEKIEQVKLTFPHAIPAGPADIRRPGAADGVPCGMKIND
jgi:aminopeptidase N